MKNQIEIETQAHTPGPWDLIQLRNGMPMVNCWRIGTGKFGEIARTAHLPTDVNPGENEANARLIAAAPELVAALDRLQSMPNDPRAHRQALDALAKAKGGAA